MKRVNPQKETQNIIIGEEKKEVRILGHKNRQLQNPFQTFIKSGQAPLTTHSDPSFNSNQGRFLIHKIKPQARKQLGFRASALSKAVSIQVYATLDAGLIIRLESSRGKPWTSITLNLCSLS